MRTLTGIPASPGIAIGPVCRLVRGEAGAFPARSALTEAEEESRYSAAVEEVKRQLDRLCEKAAVEAGGEAALIFDMHKLMLDDLDFVEAVSERIGGGFTAEAAVERASGAFAALFDAMEDETMRARGADVRDVACRLLAALGGGGGLRAPAAPSVAAAEDLLPSDTMALERGLALAFVTGRGSHTSHAAILSRTLGIPAVMGVPGLMEALAGGETAIVDGGEGVLILSPDGDTLARYRARQAAALRERDALGAYKKRKSATQDGVAVDICANIASVADADAAAETGADGVGLMRSEFLFLDGAALPGEEEQYRAYRAVLEKMEGRRVVVRTLDIGADKVPACLKLPREENPALGLRGVRLCLGREELFRPQLRALLRASVHGRLAVMFPMIGRLEELRAAKRVLAECRRELLAEGAAVSDALEVGMMVEVPAAAVMSDVFAREVDFFSIGTNDLTQYTLAADRLNEGVSALFDEGDEAVLRLIAHTARSAAAAGIWCGVCGESAGDPALLPFFVKAGVRELSVSPGRVLALRRALTELDSTAL